jgi:hypothetical protein
VRTYAADLREANLSDANFGLANLRYADLWQADLRNAVLERALLLDADWRTCPCAFPGRARSPADASSDACTAFCG